jgi:hypothetical protein
LALSRAREKSPDSGPPELESQILEELDDHRLMFSGGRIDMREDEWRKVFTQSENAAQAQLLSGSSVAQQLASALAKSEASKSVVEQLNATISRDLGEFYALPERAERLKTLLSSIAHERRCLDQAALKSEYKRIYKGMVEHPERNVDASAMAFLVEQTVTAQWRLEVLKEIEEASLSSLEALQDASRKLARELGRPAHRI